MANFPRDRFDDLPEGSGRVGAHRAKPRNARGLRWFGWSALATGILVVIGAVLVSVANGRPLVDLAGGQPTAAASSAVPATDQPITNPADVDPELQLSVTVLNGSSIEGLAAQASGLLEDEGWPVGTVGNASQRNVTTTTVYYNAPQFEGIALGIAQRLGTGIATQLSTSFQGAQVTVVLGSDWKSPET